MLTRAVRLLSLLLLLTLGVGAVQAAGPLGRGAPAAAPAEESWVPAPLRDLTAAVADAQRTLNQRLAAEVRALKDGRSWTPAFALIGLAFAYGVLHAAGPGHGKVVVSTYFLARRARWREGLGLAAAGSALQAVTAILLVGVLAAVVDLGATTVLRQTQWLEVVGYALMTLLGGWMLWRVARGRDACGHDHGHGHHHHDGACAHGHDHAHGHAHSHAAPGPRRDFVAAAFAVGIRPCTGALLVLLFALANGIFSVGAMATVAMAVGSFLTVAALGSGAIGLRKLVDRWGDRRGALVQRWLGGAGALAVFGVGALLLAASLTQDVTGLGALAG